MPALYDDLAVWWPLISAPEDYAEEAAFFRQALEDAASIPVLDVLELGCGGGNNASHLKTGWQMTLVDVSPHMLDISRALNPDAGHHQGDMRFFRIDRLFDAVFVHDAVDYMLSEDDLRAAFQTAFAHLKPGGAALFAPDHTRENFAPSTDHGGHDGHGGRAARYLSWTRDFDPGDTVVETDYAFILSEGADARVVIDRHLTGIFSRNEWLAWLADAGFESEALPFQHSTFAPDAGIEIFIARKPAGPLHESPLAR
ncbi:MAG TPA: class I SAM-dependent methyltransferase [Dehalococcoidia bacterium]|nr:class I SAM-dependent methyltransferase [Dehalococcoidia bacterium]